MKKNHVFTSTLAVFAVSAACMFSGNAAAAGSEQASKRESTSTLSKVNAWNQHGGLARVIDGGLRGELHLTRSSTDAAAWPAPASLSLTSMNSAPSASDSDITPYTESRLSNASMSYVSAAAAPGDALAQAGNPAPELGAASMALVAVGLLLLSTRRRYSQKFTR